MTDLLPSSALNEQDHRGTQPDWWHWLHRWNAQQAGYLPDRETRFQIMLDVLGILLPESFVALDLACGPGAISQRLLTRFPGAQSIAVDLDPVLLALGQGALGDWEGRLRWVAADLRQAAWVEQLGVTTVDAVLSTTALHWLPVEDLVRLYWQLGALVRPGGLLLNGDNMKFAPHLPSFRKVATTLREGRWSDASFAELGVENWQQWWAALAQEPALTELIAERERYFANREQTWSNPVYEVHAAALREAGFREVGVIWRNGDNCVLMAVH
jgi:trans-aconitate methyltransferase